ncbi:MAG: WYL domain-containing protein [Muribaculaceae bacterium]|nr:WYL domain-containing protein [Muribaculaceae bacterium]
MTQLQKYTWLIDTIRKAGRISHKELSEKWESNKDLSEGKPLHRSTFNRWRDAILSQFRIIINCQKSGGYLYYIENPEAIDDDRFGKWLLDYFGTGNTIGEHLSIKDRILVEDIPAGREHLMTMLEAMEENHCVNITYRPFNTGYTCVYKVEPLCVKLFENRWYLLGRDDRGENCIYALDRVESSEITSDSFKLPEGFLAERFFSERYGVVLGHDLKPERIVIRANEHHKNYLKTHTLHHSQRQIEDFGEYADFELFLTPTYDFIMKLLQVGPMIEVTSPDTLRDTMKTWISDMDNLYKLNQE